MGAPFAGVIDIELIGNFEQTQAMLRYLETRLTFAELSLFLKEDLEPYLKERLKARFAGEGDDVSGPWAPLSPATQNIRAWGRDNGMWDVGDDHPINQRTHEMYQYLTEGQWPIVAMGAGTGAILSSPNDQNNNREMRSKLGQAQHGGKGPARPVLGLNSVDLAYFLVLFGLHLAGPAMPAMSKQGAIGSSGSGAIGAIESYDSL